MEEWWTRHFFFFFFFNSILACRIIPMERPWAEPSRPRARPNENIKIISWTRHSRKGKGTWGVEKEERKRRGRSWRVSLA